MERNIIEEPQLSSSSILYAEFLRMRGLEIDETEELNKTLREVKLLAKTTKF